MGRVVQTSIQISQTVHTTLSLYFGDVSIFHSKCNLIRGSDIYSYETRGRHNYRTGRHGIVVHDRFTMVSGVNFVNELPNFIKSAKAMLCP